MAIVLVCAEFERYAVSESGQRKSMPFKETKAVTIELMTPHAVPCDKVCSMNLHLAVAQKCTRVFID